MYERRAAGTHGRATLGADTSALQKRDDHANSIFAPWWNDRGEEEGTASLCAYLTQMLKLSYALQYHRKLRRIDRASEKTVPGTKAPRTYPRTREFYIRCNLFAEKSATRKTKRGDAEAEERWKRKLRASSNLKSATIPSTSREIPPRQSADTAGIGVIYRIVASRRGRARIAIRPPTALRDVGAIRVRGNRAWRIGTSKCT